MGMNHSYPHAVCLLVVYDSGEILAISRRNDPSQVGLPGGKVDPGETPFQAVIRETSEEIGLKVQVSDLKPIYRGICPGDVTFMVTTYLYCGEAPELESLEAETGMVVTKQSIATLTDPKSSPFAAYNECVFFALIQQRASKH